MGKASRLVGAAVAVAALSGSGCVFVVGAGIGAGGLAVYQHISGEYSKLCNRGIDEAAVAAEEALKDMGILIVNSTHDAQQGRINARLLDDTAVTVRLEAEGQYMTQVYVRVGLFGDKTLSEMFFQKMDERLGTGPALSAAADRR